MEALELARWQFGITTVYHFLMVPLTIGLGLVVAIMQTMWVRTGKAQYLRMTKFWGKLFLINFIVGVATGLVQEFQFGMAWSEYSRFVGDVFGAPLAMESLLAFFVESIFLGLWIFGWDRLPKKLHLATIWAASSASIMSAYFILAANSWMQHPVGVEMIEGRPVLVDIWAVLTNNTLLVAFPHTIFGAFSVSGGFLLGISWYHLWKRRRDGIDTVEADGKVLVGDVESTGRDRTDYQVWLQSLRIGAVIAIFSFAGVAVTGDLQAKLMFEQQPMKMAAAEAACHDGTGFSVLSLGNPGSQDCDDIVAVVEVPGMLSFMANGDFNTEVKGVNSLLPEYQEKFGTNLPDDPIYGERAGSEIDYVPVMEVTYWGFRIMITFGVLAACAAAVALLIVRKGAVPESKWLMRLAVFGILAPFGANAAGWIFTEMGRQPFVVAPNPDPNGIDNVFMFTAAAVSPGVSVGELAASLITFTAIYGILLVVEVRMLFTYVRGGVPSAMPELLHNHNGRDDDGASDGKDEGDVLAFAY
ncbi:cytochrome ubiquinol oxidase subunit I [Arthrobacter echini]|uniref:Cytochrome ubiquinol oxidase subunit I n=2 Tax=Arthrobacter echini TaxID=1529066 RepID=A0A5D0XIP8_9MICC|nr:cytochrome ubiquinol oxidase subunit I [Arthrobacter echini]THJ65668.1 cytochrome ubiquinol oxidase subunit I [Arthrobacter echini]TYC96464.1 cytochrome ubiquinol oxidase subunit I [Arthrobacter echini]